MTGYTPAYVINGKHFNLWETPPIINAPWPGISESICWGEKEG